MIRRSLCLLALLVTVLGGCASDGVEVSTAFDPLTPFPRQATWLWDRAASHIPDDPRFAQLDIEPLIQETASEALAARGYQQGQGSGHYKLSYQLAAFSWIGGTESRSIGTLSLTLVEAASGRRVWMGFVRADILVGLSREERKVRLRSALDRLLEKFPPTQRGDS